MDSTVLVALLSLVGTLFGSLAGIVGPITWATLLGV